VVVNVKTVVGCLIAVGLAPTGIPKGENGSEFSGLLITHIPPKMVCG
jgi:hypothetical protein